MSAARAALAGAVLIAGGCAAALKEPPPIDVLAARKTAQGPPASPARGVDALLRDAAVAFAARPAVDKVREAERLFLEAAAQDETRIEGLVGAVRAKAWLCEHEPERAPREDLAVSAVQTAQWCERRVPDRAECDYWLAIALGLQAREKPSTAEDGLKKMVERLERAGAAEPTLEDAGPLRVLALVLLRAPGWPAGPGDRERGLDEAQRAVDLRPDHPPNLLVLAEAQAKNQQGEMAQATYRRALELASDAARHGDPDAPEWEREARRALTP